MGRVFRADVMLMRSRKLISLGHNALAGIIYFLSFLAFLFQAATGFALYSSMSHAWLPRMFAWITPLMGGDFAVRQWHHIMMWFFILFVIVHVYLVFYHDYIEGRGTTSSMVGGWKFEREDEE
jgi:Ni/Fe-hydrogenase 1 B-type cytochrome subunit